MKGNVRKFGLIGKGISYSMSTILHERVFEIENIDDATYEILDIDDIESNIENLKSEYSGFNVTKPYKIEIMNYLDEIDEEAKVIGSVNTVVNIGGKLKGYNTDIDGIIDTFNLDGVSVRNKRCLLIGYGGVAKTVIYALNKMGAGVIAVTGRNEEKMQAFRDEAQNIGIEVAIDNHPHNNYDIVINATSLGTSRDHKTPIDVSLIQGIEYYFDLVYNPRKTVLMKKCEDLGIKTRDGLYMLASQGVKSEEYYQNRKFKKDIKNDVYLYLAGEIFKKTLMKEEKKSITLVGFMGAGKSTIANELGKVLHMNIVDTDKLIEEKYGRIRDIFLFHGEEAFRDLETLILRCALDENNIVSTGGGIVMKDDNISIINNAKTLTVFLDVPFDILKERVKGTDRPLFKDKVKAKELFHYRYPRYKSVADVTIDASEPIVNIIDDIMKYSN